MTKNEIKKTILESVKKSFEDFQQNPFLFMYENDMQSHLFVLLRNSLMDEFIEVKNHNLPETFKMHIINTEYSNKIAISCLDKEQSLLMISEKKDRDISSFLWRLPIMVGIEVKLVPYDDFRKNLNVCIKDRDRLLFYHEEEEKKADEINWLQLTYLQNEAALRNFESKEHPLREIGPDFKLEFNSIYIIPAKGFVRQLL